MIAPIVFTLLAAPITLEEVRAASRQNLDALRAEIELRRQALGVSVSKAAIFPQVQLGAQAQGYYAGPQRVLNNTPIIDQNTGEVTGFNQTIAPLNVSTSRANYSLNLTVTQLIYDGGRWWNAIAQAGASERAAEGQLEEQRLVAELEAVNRFYQLLSAQFSLNVFDNAVKNSETQLNRADNLFEAARGGKLDALTAGVNLNNDRVNVLRQRQTVTNAQVELLKWLGQPTREIEAVDPGMLALERAQTAAPTFESAMGVARRHRPLLKALDAQVEVAQKAVDVAWAPFLPSVSLQGGYQRSAPSADPFFTDPSRNNSVWGGLNLSWNVFNGFGNYGQLQQQRETLSQSTLQRERAELDLGGDVRRALQTLTTQMQVAQIAAENLKLTEATLKLAEERFGAGAGSTLEVRDAQVKLINAQLTRLQSRIDVEVARAALKRVVGAEVEEVR